jgi:hypothetical protein
LSVDEGEIITILNKNTGSPDWWEGEGRQGKGQFPANYVQILEESSSAYNSIPTRIDTTKTTNQPQLQAKAVYDYAAASPDEISIREGDIITVIDSSDPDWWKGELKGQIGTFPANYVEKME